MSDNSPRSYFLLLTIPIAVASWVISLVSQSIVTAQIGNTLVGPLWFAVILQLFVLLILIYGLLSNTLQAYHATITTFSTLIIVFAVLGVNTNIFNPLISAQKALSAGWLILAIINSLWAIYFTTHPISHALSYGAPVELQAQKPRYQLGVDQRPDIPKPESEPGEGYQVDEEAPPRSSLIPSVPTNIDNPSTSRRTTTNISSTHTPGPSRPHTLLTNPHSPMSNANGNEGGGGGTARTSAAMTSSTSGGADLSELSMKSAETGGPARSAPVSPVDSPGPGARHSRAGDAGKTAMGMGMGTGAGTSTSTSTSTSETPNPASASQQKEYLWRAEALYKYDGQDADPNELSFKKGDILEISDKSGKWWEGRRADGKVGIAPSNYLRLL